MTITTKIGDTGQTNCGNKRVDKDDILVEAIGSIDEFQAILELIKADKKIINDLREIMGEIGNNIKSLNYDLRVRELEKEIEKSEIYLNKFVVFKTKEARELNWARTVCRRAERRLVSLNKIEKIDAKILIYFNRLSDYLFVKAVENN